MVLAGVFGFRNLFVLLTIFLQFVFLAFFVRHVVFVMAAAQVAATDRAVPSADSRFCPSVSVLVACRNEESVVEGLTDSLLGLEYPRDRLQIIIVDDGSSDRTGDLLDAMASVDPRLRCIHRHPNAGGGKSGALNEALEVASGSVIVVFDADHKPHRDVLKRIVRHFEDPVVGAVQGRCKIRHSPGALLTELIALDYMAGYLVNEYGRQFMFQLPAYGGANCAVRASSLRAMGGWNPNSVTEDTDLTLRLVLSGQRVRYDITAVDEEEGVTTLAQYWRQRYRWARGHQQVWRELRRAVWMSSRLSVPEKLETTMFLLVFHLPVASGFGLLLTVFWLLYGSKVSVLMFHHLFIVWAFLFLGPLLELGSAFLLAGVERRQAFRLLFFLPLSLLSAGLCTKALIDGLLGRPYSWVKTPRAADMARTRKSG